MPMDLPRSYQRENLTSRSNQGGPWFVEEFQVATQSDLEDFQPTLFLSRLWLEDYEDIEYDEFILEEEEEGEEAPVYEQVDIASVAQAIPISTSEADCPICHEDDGTPFVAFNACKHAFHEGCLSTWAAVKASTFTYPMCRTEICKRRRVRRTPVDVLDLESSIFADE
jgi:hypothetical protein